MGDRDSDSDGEEPRLSNNFMQALVQYGTFYNPASLHYGYASATSQVGCDHCSRSNIPECLAMPLSETDVCLTCAVRYVVGTHCSGLTVPDALIAVQGLTQFAVCNNDPSRASEWTAILLHTNSAGRVCGGHSGFLAAAAAVPGPAANDNGNAGLEDSDDSDESFALDRAGPPGGSDAGAEDSDDGSVTVRFPGPFADANVGAGFATIVTTNTAVVAAYDTDDEE